MFELDKVKRETKILEIVETDSAVMTGVKLPIRPTQTFSVHRIPIQFVVYNHLNDRFASKRMEYELDNGTKLDLSSEEALKLIEKFIWESNINSNNDTLQDLAKNGQLKYGIITKDGRIIDGNRRASLIRKLYFSDDKEFPNINKENFRYFNCIVLPDNISDDEMIVLETKIQMGEDDKVDYNPIEKYIKIDNLISKGKSYEEVKNMIKSIKNVKKAEEMHNIFKLMKEYLRYIDAPDHFSLIEKMEDHFITLNSTISYFKKGTYVADWNPNETDFAIFETVAFNYIRKGHEGKDFRNLMGGQTTQNGIFSRKDVWNKFKEKHDGIIDSIDYDLKKTKFDSVKQREIYWSNKASRSLENIFINAKESVTNRKNEDKPKELAEGALEKLQLIDIESLVFKYSTNEHSLEDIKAVYELIEDIRKTSESIKSKIITDVFKKN